MTVVEQRTHQLIAEINHQLDLLVGLLATSQQSSAQPAGEDHSELLRLIEALFSNLDENRLHQEIVAGAMQLTQAERGFLMLLEGRGKLRFKAGLGVTQELLMSGSFDGSRSIIKEVVTGGQPVLRGPPASAPVSESMSKTSLQSALCVPVPIGRRKKRVKGSVKVAGILYVDSRGMDQMLSPEDLKTLVTFSRHCSIALENAWLYSDERL